MWRIAIRTLLGAASVLLLATACSNTSAARPAKDSPAATTNTGTAVSVGLDQWAVKPTTTTLSAGPVTFNVSNEGTIPHEFVVLKTNTKASKIPIATFEGQADRINEDTSGTNVGETGDLNPAESKSVTIDLQPGHYVFLCNLPAHYQSGMHVDVTVS
jgi:uncharacterized cupredoxin-like copper-binding protein